VHPIAVGEDELHLAGHQRGGLAREDCRQQEAGRGGPQEAGGRRLADDDGLEVLGTEGAAERFAQVAREIES
jgi:hypothetical protein